MFWMENNREVGLIDRYGNDHFQQKYVPREERHASSAWLNSLHHSLGVCWEHSALLAPYFVFLLVSEKYMLGTCVFLFQKESISSTRWPLSLNGPKLGFRLQTCLNPEFLLSLDSGERQSELRYGYRCSSDMELMSLHKHTIPPCLFKTDKIYLSLHMQRCQAIFFYYKLHSHQISRQQIIQCRTVSLSI